MSPCPGLDRPGSRIYATHVVTTLSADQAAELPLPDGSNLIDIKPARSMRDRLAQMFGRGKQ